MPISLAIVLLAGVNEVKLLTPYPGSKEIAEPAVKEFDTYDLVISGTDSAKGQCGRKQPLEGRVVKIALENPAGRTEHEIFANYRDAAAKAGFKTIFTCREEECYADGKPSNNIGDCGQRSISWFPQAGTRYLAARLPRKDGDVFLAVHVQRHRTDLHYATVKPMETGLVVADLAALKAGLDAEGHVAVYGISFDTGRAEIRPESAPALAEIVKLLKERPNLKIYVVGHTDNVGGRDANVALSMRRAEAVVEELKQKHGIAAARLRPEGSGPWSPVATNATPEGRSKNRRVDLVEQ